VTYDLVASLRASAEWIKDVEHESWFSTADLQNDAAAEIERLRAQVAELKDAKHWLNEDLLRMRSNLARTQAEIEWVRRD
jgi:peptidoglycan hydrolase CwlO-like protein